MNFDIVRSSFNNDTNAINCFLRTAKEVFHPNPISHPNAQFFISDIEIENEEKLLEWLTTHGLQEFHEYMEEKFNTIFPKETKTHIQDKETVQE